MSTIKGVILAGGRGTRLGDLTRVTNKHLLPVYNQPMIYYPIQKMVEAGIRDVMVVTGDEHAGAFIDLLGDGTQLGLHKLEYKYQPTPAGIAQALLLTEQWADYTKLCVILGDNIFKDPLKPYLTAFMAQTKGARILLHKTSTPERFGVAEFKSGELFRIVEKPVDICSNLAVTGIYFYDSKVYDYIRKCRVSARGELEITDVNNMYLLDNRLQYQILPNFWSDAGTFESLYAATTAMRELHAGREATLPR